MSAPANPVMASVDSQKLRVRNSARPSTTRQRTQAPWLPGVSRYAFRPVPRRYSTYASASASRVAPLQMRAITMLLLPRLVRRSGGVTRPCSRPSYQHDLAGLEVLGDAFGTEPGMVERSIRVGDRHVLVIDAVQMEWLD